MSKPTDPPSLVDILAREHAARRLLIEAEAASVIAHDTHADADVDTHAAADSGASSPRLLVEELTRKCCERRAALDDEARRG